MLPPGADDLGSGAAEDAALARDLFASQLAEHTRDFGPDHPDTCASANTTPAGLPGPTPTRSPCPQPA